MGMASQLPLTYQNCCITDSSVTTDEDPHLRIDIPILSPEDPEHTTLPLGRAHAIPTATTPKTPWKPRISLMAEVDDLLKQGIVHNYSCKSEHSTMGKEAATEADMSLSHKAEVPALTNGHLLSSKHGGGGGFLGE